MLAIIDHGASNLKSLTHTIKSIGIDFSVIESPNEIINYDRIILPGVGNFGGVSNKMESSGWFDSIKEHTTIREKPILGICLGMQLLSTYSDETTSISDDSQSNIGLGLIDGHVVKIPENIDKKIRVPHIGWNNVHHRASNVLFKDIPSNTDFYFVHSYFFQNKYPEDVVSTTNHGINFASSIGRNNIYGVQFHPEKSSKAGIKLLDNFMRLT